ncbi:MAG: hypothetical protein ACPIOQ_34655 [Promethearchaeia archaeon]
MPAPTGDSRLAGIPGIGIDFGTGENCVATWSASKKRIETIPAGETDNNGVSCASPAWSQHTHPNSILTRAAPRLGRSLTWPCAQDYLFRHADPPG